MFKFIIRRLGYGVLTLFIISTITFMLIHAIPGDPMNKGGKKLPEKSQMIFKQKYGLDKPLYKQYGMFLKRLVIHQDLGDSMVYVGRSINKIIKKKAPISAVIGGQALIFQLIIGIPLGILAAFRRGKWQDQATNVLVVVLRCIPGFVFAALLQYVFTVKLKLFPTTGWGSFKFTVLPTLAMGLPGIANYAKFMRNSTLNVVNQDYITTAKAKGVARIPLVWKHVIRNSIIPIITLIGPAIGFIFAGAFIIERMFAIPGLGNYYVRAVGQSDYSMIMGLTIFFAIIYIASLILVDILYGVADPRMRIGNKK